MAIRILVAFLLVCRINAATYVACEGDSLTAGSGANPSGSNYVSQLAGMLPNTLFDNLGVAGDQIQNIYDATDATTHLASQSGRGKRTAVLWIGINDVANGRTMAQVTTNMLQWMSNVRSADAGCKIVLCTIMKAGTVTGTPETHRQNINSWILANSGADYTLDLASNAALDDPNDSTYFDADTVHLKNAGYSAVAVAMRDLLIANSRHIDTYYVATTGNDSNTGDSASKWLTVGKAAATVIAGDVVSISAGNYAENINEATSGTVSRPISYLTTGAVTLRSFRVSGSYVSVRDMAMTGDGLTASTIGIVHTDAGSKSCVFSNISITGTGGYEAGAYVVWAQGTNHYLDHFCITNSNNETVILGPGTGHTVTNFWMTGTNGWDAFTVRGSSMSIVHNYLTNWSNPSYGLPGGQANHADFIQAFGDLSDTVTNTVVGENTFILGITVQLGNITDDNEDGTISGFIFRNNLFVDVSNTLNLYAPDCSFYNNTYVRCAGNSGFVLTVASSGAGHANNTTIKNNIFHQSGYADQNNRGWYDVGAVTGFAADYNLVIGTGAGTTKTGFTETHGINGSDPLFVSENDFRLQANSPAIGAGTILTSYFTADKNGVIRSAPWDIGAFEYTGSEPGPPSPASGYNVNVLRIGR